jgi:ribosomal 50S subunit-recycling heat shock protein
MKMKRILSVVCLLFAGFISQYAVAADSADAPAVMVSNYLSASVSVVGIDKKKRVLTLRDAQGGKFEVTAGPEVRNFDQIKQGDEIVVEYHQAAVSTLEKVEKATSATSAETVQLAPKGEKPGAVAAMTVPIVAKVVEVDHESRELTVKGPRGRFVTVKVPEDLKAFDELKPGDMISAQYTEAVAISVRTTGKNKKK